MDFSIDVTAVFGYASDIITAMLPVVYVGAGIGLGFIVVNKIVSAFRGG